MVSNSSPLPNRFLLVYASETGQARSIAEEISTVAGAHGLKAVVECISGVDRKFRLEEEDVVVFVVSTTGDGEPPEAARKFWRRIKKGDVEDRFSRLRIAVLGLGDTNYTQFCNFGKSLHRRLTQLGAVDYVAPGWADDAVGLELTVEPWIEKLLPALHKTLGVGAECPECRKIGRLNIGRGSGGMGDAKVPEDASLTRSSAFDGLSLTLPPRPVEFLTLEFGDAPHVTPPLCRHHLRNPPSIAVGCDVFSGKVVEFRRLTTHAAEKQKFEISFAAPEDLDWREGDSFGIFCPNPEEEVAFVLSRLAVDLEQAEKKDFALSKDAESKKKLPEHVPVGGCTLQHALQWCCNLRAPLKKAFLLALSDSCADEREKRRFLELSSRQGSAEYAKFVAEPGLCLLDLLHAFPSCKPKPERILEFLPRLLPRPYSVIYSSAQSRILRFAYSLVEIPGDSSGRKSRQGICTGWLTKVFDFDAFGLEKLRVSQEQKSESLLEVREHAPALLPIDSVKGRVTSNDYRL